MRTRRVVARVVAATAALVMLAGCVAERAAQPAKDYEQAPYETGTVSMSINQKTGICTVTFKPITRKKLDRKKGLVIDKGPFKAYTIKDKKPLVGHHKLCMVAKNPGSTRFKTTGWHFVGKPVDYHIDKDHKRSIRYLNVHEVAKNYTGKLKFDCYITWKAYGKVLTGDTAWPDVDEKHVTWSSKCNGKREAANGYKAKAKGRTPGVDLAYRVEPERWTKPVDAHF